MHKSNDLSQKKNFQKNSPMSFTWKKIEFKIFSIFLKLRVPISLNYIINYTGENALLVEVICGIFAYSHGAINPVFYYLHNKTLRSAYRNFFGIFFKKEKQNIETVLTIPNQRRVDNITLSKINWSSGLEIWRKKIPKDNQRFIFLKNFYFVK